MIYVVAYARLAIVFYLLPILGDRILSNLIVKNSIISLVIIGLWPCYEPDIVTERGLISVLVEECFMGLLLATVLCIPFWIVIALGDILDNQRGATINDIFDPLSGGQNSVLSAFFNFSFGMIFFSSNGMLLLMNALMKSYQYLPQGHDISGVNWSKAGKLLVELVECSIMLAAPVIIVLLVTEILLGVFARYCPQLNAFSLSLTLKSFITFIIFLLYGLNALADEPLKYFSINSLYVFFPSG
ncbi:Type III secretion apparatus [Erwinia tasmaniensis Et1/99]|uniref:Type III secretion apparatus n=2 Tax=Erwinia tasmaniensis TaxID=338565 RepID=B2VEH3_ERWT9|nr:Type III secretion apparatus [Erwinia tasmaniensis Et1/99]